MPWTGGGSSPIIKGAVLTFAELPNVVASEGQLWFVKNPDRAFFPKYPRGAYYSDGITWEITPIKVKWSEDAGSVLNWTDWSLWYTAADDIGNGDRITYNGAVYKNITGTQSATAPDADLTNWDNAFPQGTIYVAKKGGDFTTIKEACDSVTGSTIDNPFYIEVQPGKYDELPFKVPNYTTLYLNNARVCPSQSGDFIELGDTSAIRKGAISCVAESGATIYTTSFAGGVVDTVRLEGTQSAGNIGFRASAGGRLTILNTSCSGAGTAYFANQGAVLFNTIIATNADIGLRVANGGVAIGIAFASLERVDADIQQDDAFSSIRLVSGLLNTDKIIAENWDLLKLTYTSDKEDDQAFIISQELNVGVPELGQESVLGEGDSYTRGMIVYTETSGGTFVDVSAAARSASGSTFTFPDVTANNAIYVASTLNNTSDVLAHYGIKHKITTAAVTGTGEIVIEYWNGSAWTDLAGMEADSGDKYLPHASSYFENTGSHHIRYNSSLAIGGWTKNDPITPAVGTDYYWIRFGIDSTITTAPIFEQWKLHTNRSEINADGWVEYFGKARPIAQLGLDFSGAKPFEGNMQNQKLYIAVDVGVGFTQNKFNGTADKTGISGFLPFDFDTSSPLRLQWSGQANTTQTIEWTIRASWVTDNGIDLYYTTETASTAIVKTVTVSKAITADLVSMFEVEIDLREMLSRREDGFGDELWISMQPSTLSGAFALTSTQAVYTRWCNGGHV